AGRGKSGRGGVEPGTQSGPGLSPALPGYGGVSQKDHNQRGGERKAPGTESDLVGRKMSARHDSCPYGGAVSGSDGWIVVQVQRHKEAAVQADLGARGTPGSGPCRG